LILSRKIFDGVKDVSMFGGAADGKPMCVVVVYRGQNCSSFLNLKSFKNNIQVLLAMK